MTVPLYVRIEATAPKFDGHVARHHLTGRLVFREVAADATGVATRRHFDGWLATIEGMVRVHPSGLPGSREYRAETCEGDQQPTFGAATSAATALGD